MIADNQTKAKRQLLLTLFYELKNIKAHVDIWKKFFFCGTIGIFRPCSRYVWTVLEVCFDCARGMLRPFSRYVSTVLEICFDRSRGMFRPFSRYVLTVLEVCFDCSRGMFGPYLSYVWTVIDHARGMFQS